MLTVCKKDNCAGCMACVEICPKNAIKIIDTIGEYNAVIDKEKCIDCDACRNVCQVNNPPKLQKCTYWKEGWAEDEAIRKSSSSGGFATAIIHAFLKGNGVVCSCRADKNGFGFAFADREEQYSEFSGSKYVKSNPSGIYKKIRKLLREGKKVLFIGLPCQAAALKNFIGENDNLYIADLICHGSPSPKALERFLADYNIKLSDAESITFRTGNDFHIEKDGKRLMVLRDSYTRAFLEGGFYTENCYNCRYAALERVSDLTLGDSWGTELPNEEVTNGISLALCQTEKGIELLKNSNLKLLDTNLNKAVEYNHQLNHPSVRHSKRYKLISELKKGTKFKTITMKVFPKRYLKYFVYNSLNKIGIKK